MKRQGVIHRCLRRGRWRKDLRYRRAVFRDDPCSPSAEGSDIRTIKAASIVQQEGYANLIILGDKNKIEEMANVTDTTTHTIELSLTKEAGMWKVNQLSDEDISKLHGLY